MKKLIRIICLVLSISLLSGCSFSSMIMPYLPGAKETEDNSGATIHIRVTETTSDTKNETEMTDPPETSVTEETEPVEKETIETEPETVIEDTESEETTPPETEPLPTETEPPITEEQGSDHSSEDPTPTQRPTADYASVEELIDSMTLSEKILQMMIVAPEQIGGSSYVADYQMEQALSDMPVGGFIFFSENIDYRQQVIDLIDGVQSMSKIGMYIAVDEEGGTVSRLGRNPYMDFPAFHDMIYTWGWNEAYSIGYTIGSEMRKLGFNVDFAPVADVNSNPNNPVIGDRSFSSDPYDAADLVNGCVTGFNDAGMSSTLKHFPGHGDTDSDTHYGEAVLYKTLDELWECELIPFQSGINAGAPFIMMAHITLPYIVDDYTPASLSYTITTGLLRNTLGYNGIIITDALNMGAIANNYSSAEAAVLAIEAGVDILLMPNDPYSALQGVLDAVYSGRISESRIDESVRRILNHKAANGII